MQAQTAQVSKTCLSIRPVFFYFFCYMLPHHHAPIPKTEAHRVSTNPLPRTLDRMRITRTAILRHQLCSSRADTQQGLGVPGRRERCHAGPSTVPGYLDINAAVAAQISNFLTAACRRVARFHSFVTVSSTTVSSGVYLQHEPRWFFFFATFRRYRSLCFGGRFVVL